MGKNSGNVIGRRKMQLSTQPRKKPRRRETYKTDTGKGGGKLGKKNRDRGKVESRIGKRGRRADRRAASAGMAGKGGQSRVRRKGARGFWNVWQAANRRSGTGTQEKGGSVIRPKWERRKEAKSDLA